MRARRRTNRRGTCLPQKNVRDMLESDVKRNQIETGLGKRRGTPASILCSLFPARPPSATLPLQPH
jgi:hypothetical protein